MAKKTPSAPDADNTALRAAYHDGPEEIRFCGRSWRRGAAQDVTPEEWKAMRTRHDCAGFGFALEPPAPPDQTTGSGESTTDNEERT